MYNSTLKYATSLILSKEASHVLEFGVYTGGSLRLLRKSLPKRFKIFGFDSFLGLPEDWIGTCLRKGQFSTNLVEPIIPNTTIISGWFDTTIDTQYLPIAQDIALLRLDADLYSSTKTILWKINNYIKIGTIIVCDEWFYNHSTNFCDQEQRAVKEWAEVFNRKFNIVPYSGDKSAEGMERIILEVVS